jgi:5-methylcytosine-specific restriction endonuclease McrA
MILREATIQYKGYDPANLKSKSNKRICCSCDICGKVRYVNYQFYRDLCFFCAHYKPKIKVICKICGEEFKSKSSSNRKFCSKECYNESKIKRIKLICQQCNKEFEVVLSHKNQKFCSKKCLGKSESGNKHWNWRGEIIGKICKWCGNIMENRDRIFCSHKCSSNYNRGKNHINYDLNLTDEDRTDRKYVYGYRNWRLSVYKRDNFTCQKCNKLGNGNINAHHIESYNSNPDLRISLENGITLCEDCHKDFHNKYGRGNNNKEQFIEFYGDK